MASIKAIAAIALTLMIAVPIGLGYAFASEEQTTTTWQTDSTANATDLLLNYNSYYTAEYMNPQNNKELLTYDGSSYTLATPNYQSVTSTYTSLPEYTTVTGTLSLGSSTTSTFSSPGTGETFGTSTADHVISKYPMTSITYNRSSYLDTATITDYGSNSYSFSFGSVYMVQDGASTYSLYSIIGTTLVHSEAEWATNWLVTINNASSADNSVTIITRDYTQVDPNIGADYSFTTSDYCSLKLVTSSQTYYLALTEATSVLVTTSGTVTLGGTDVYEGVTGLYIAEQPSVSSITYSYSAAATGSYADPADGWTLTGASSEWWLNGQQNESVRLMVHLDSGESLAVGPTASASSAVLATLSYDGSTLTVTDVAASTSSALGNYQYAMIVLTQTEATVYGLSAWPTLGVWPTTFNQVTVDYADISEPFRYIYMSGDASFRVDLAQIVAGTYPSTKDLTLDLSEKYPAQSLTFTLKSIALYGDSVSFGGTAFTVTDGKISGTDADGESFTVTLRGAVVRYVYGDSGYTVSVGGHELTGTAGTVYFGGEWSLTSSISLISQTTSTQQVWAPGEFAFDKEDFAACGLLVAGACLVGLGMTGSRSGIKMGMLLMICGGAGLIYLTLI